MYREKDRWKEKPGERSFKERNELGERSGQKKRGIVMNRKKVTGIRTGRKRQKGEVGSMRGNERVPNLW